MDLDKIDRDCLTHQANRFMHFGTEKLLEPIDFLRVVLGGTDEEIEEMLRAMRDPETKHLYG